MTAMPDEYKPFPHWMEPLIAGDEDSFIAGLNTVDDIDETDANGWTALHYASGKGQVRAIKALLDRGADIEKRTTAFGQTALLHATEQGRLNAVEVLLAEGAVIDTREGGGQLRKPTTIAIQKKRPDILRALLEAIKDATQRKQATTETLQQALLYRIFDSANLLIDEYGADINAPNISWRTSLHMAFDTRNVSAAIYLINRGADLSVQDEDGDTPLDVMRMAMDAEQQGQVQKALATRSLNNAKRIKAIRQLRPSGPAPR